jgi:hypothetical protein
MNPEVRSLHARYGRGYAGKVLALCPVRYVLLTFTSGNDGIVHSQRL